MTKEELKTRIVELLPTATIDETGEWLSIQIPPAEIVHVTAQLRNDPVLNFDFLFCLTCVDWRTHLSMVYHFTSTQHHQPLVVKSQLDRNNPAIESVTHIWKTAIFHEREVYEMFGVNFLNHPDLRLLILPDGWEGRKPMLKDFEDPVNMIRL